MTSLKGKFKTAYLYVKNIIDDIHLYTNKDELVVKDLIWLLSWVAGIQAVVTKGSTDNQSLSSAYLIFSLSLLMEFCMKIKDKNYLISRIVHTLFCLALIAIFILSAGSLCGAELIKNVGSIMYKLSVGIVVFIGIDWCIAFAEKDITRVDDNQELNDESNKNLEEFRKKLYSGSLGNINGGNNNE